ncbi:hypothetical protein NEUTE1DRAFT_86754 [Neurospora tetrasperma FGSC 2508]|uniref:DUF7708 domain-containing protein n=1 Tax=Neurospora tetrasperma (strain FGSC 2508 / ATCC MYA-4615 / P0657) TaxID=510951 RepID=F8MT00_NEUT8|nr:uncharacterized protein NEUTE1DRAFT_86754 [Neurospora tetrasperma FGSC 2508]EGO55982.1 hypothetical protein NEUTE1DRAFT_86754 [Neurospora tetrasperma FGSC 2508]EGZ68757.1 hypothetical protein NEUTE2DRAFT_114584 [Neurospora tetrasperma FGSC 2509]
MACAGKDISTILATPPNAAVPISSPALSRAGVTPEISPLVRRFSKKAVVEQPGSIPIRAMDAVVRRETDAQSKNQQRLVEWGRWLDFTMCSTDDTDAFPTLEVQSRDLIDTWRRLSKSLPGMGDLSPQGTWIPTISTLKQAVVQAENTMKAKKLNGFGLLKDRFHSLIQTLDDHKYMFAIIPQGDRYVSLFTGVVSFIAKASINHIKIGESFSIALSDVSRDLSYVKASAMVSDTPMMRKLVVEIYVEVFKLLCQALGWFTSRSRRTIAALDRNYYARHVQPFVDRIQKAIQRIRDKAHLVTHEAVQEIRDMGHELLQRTAGRESRLDSEEMSHEKLSRMGETLGFSSVQTLSSVEQQATHGTETECLGNSDIDAMDVEGECGSRRKPTRFRDRSDFDLERYASAFLSRYLEDGRSDVSRNPSDAFSTLLPSEVVTELQKWITAPKSNTVWVVGRPVSPFGSGLSVAALRICEIAKEIHIPCISFICKQRYSFASSFSAIRKNGSTGGLDPKEAGLIALLYSVIAQLIYLLPDEPFPSSAVLEKDNFERLDGAMSSASTALEIIRELAIHAPPSLIWVLDNVQNTESTATYTHLKAFVEFLREQESKSNSAHEEGKKPFSKVCFTTDGNCVLLSRLSQKDRGIRQIDASRMAQRRPGRVLPGGADVGQLGWSRR